MDNGASSYRRFLNGDDEGIVEIVNDYKDGLILYQEKSIINNLEVAIGHSATGYYYAQFMYQNVGFQVIADGLTQDEFVAVISSLIQQAKKYYLPNTRRYCIRSGTVAGEIRTYLYITVSHKTADEMAAQYGFNEEQKLYQGSLQSAGRKRDYPFSLQI